MGKMRRSYDGSGNPNWKGGISKFRLADDLLDLPRFAREEVRRRLLNSYVEGPNRCWNWAGRVFNSNGRACLTLGYQNHLASRLMYVLSFGRIGSYNVLHTCDNVLCINPDHLFLGTLADNSADMVAKGRSCQGERNSGAKLTEEDVLTIRRRVAAGEVQRALAREYRVCKDTINVIVKRHTWRYLK